MLEQRRELPLREQDVRFIDIVFKYSERYQTTTIRTDEMMSVNISDLFILRNEGFDVYKVVNLWKDRGWIVLNEDYKKGSHGGVGIVEFELTEKFPMKSDLSEKKGDEDSLDKDSGLTANTVNINNSFNKFSIKDSFNISPKVKKLVSFFTIIGVLATIIFGILEVFSNYYDVEGDQLMASSIHDNFYIDVSPIRVDVTGDVFSRELKVRNNSSYDESNVQISVESTQPLVDVTTPWPEGGGMIQINYVRQLVPTVYETELSVIPSNRFVKIVFYSDEPFDIEVEIY